METRGAGGRIREWADTGIPLWWTHRKHGSNLWYENGCWWCLFPWKGYGECRSWVLDFCSTVWFVSSLNAAGPAHLCHSSSPVVSKIQSGLLVPCWRSPVVLSHWSSSASASGDQSCPICSMPCGLLQPSCPHVWGSVTLMEPLHSFRVTRSPHKSLIFSSPVGQILTEHFQHCFSSGGEGIHLCHCPCAPGRPCSGEGCAGFPMKQPCCNTASFKSAQLEVPHGLGAVTQEKCLLFTPVSGTSCVWREQNWLERGGLELLEGH